MTIQEQIAIALVDIRKQRKLSQQALAKMVKTTQAVISRIENKNSSPSLELLERISTACDLKLQVFFHKKTS